MVSLEKIVLDASGKSAPLSLAKSDGQMSSIRVKLSWTAGVDLDLHAWYRTRAGKNGHIYFASKGSQREAPFIHLDEDAGVGNSAGDNEENLVITKLDHLERVVIATNIFRFFSFLHQGDNYAKYDGKVLVAVDGQAGIEVPLSSDTPGKWCVIAEIDNRGPEPRVVNVNRTQKDKPQLG